MTDRFERLVIEEIRAYGMINSGEHVIIGVSGGMDSVCLLHILKKLSSEWKFNLFAVHLNHMLRGAESQRDKDFVVNLCKEMDVPCMAVNKDVNALAEQKRLSVEEAGRLVRYQTFEAAAVKLCGKGKRHEARIALAHHRDDNVETVLLNLARGSGVNGIKGIVPVNVREGLTFVRPLLGVGRDEIEECGGIVRGTEE